MRVNALSERSDKGDREMPAKSVAQQEMMAIAEHEPDKLYARNRGVLKMSKGQMHDFASGSQKGKPGKMSELMKRVMKG